MTPRQPFPVRRGATCPNRPATLFCRRHTATARNRFMTPFHDTTAVSPTSARPGPPSSKSLSPWVRVISPRHEARGHRPACRHPAPSNRCPPHRGAPARTHSRPPGPGIDPPARVAPRSSCRPHSRAPMQSPAVALIPTNTPSDPTAARPPTPSAALPARPVAEPRAAGTHPPANQARPRNPSRTPIRPRSIRPRFKPATAGDMTPP